MNQETTRNNITFEAQISDKDLYSYNIHHAYTSMQGIFSIIVALLVLVVWLMRLSSLSLMYKVLYPMIALMFLLYLPMNLKLKSKQQMTQAVFMHPLTYTLQADGIQVSSPTADEPALLPWDYIYKIVTWKGYLLIYSNRVNAYIIPLSQIESQYQDIVAYIKEHVEDYKLTIR